MKRSCASRLASRRSVSCAQSSRGARGTVFAEVVVSAFILIMLALFCVDVGMGIVAYSLNDRACRDAARMACKGKTASQATDLANAVLKTYESAALVSQPQVESIDYQPTPGQNQIPFVTVTTTAEFRIPAPILLIGQKSGDKFVLRKRYTFPIVTLQETPPEP